MPKTNLDKTGENLKRFNAWVSYQMEYHDMNQSDIARWLGVSQQTISAKISGDIKWSLKQAFDLFLLFGEVYEFKE